MKIIANDNPANLASVVLPPLYELLASGNVPETLHTLGPNIKVGNTLKVLELTLEAIAQGDQLEAAKPNGFHCYVLSDKWAVATVAFSGEHSLMRAYAFKSLQESLHLQMELDTLKRIEKYEHSSAGEVLLLRCAALKVLAFLVIPNDKTPVLIFPITPLDEGRGEDEKPAYSEEEFFSLLQPEAKRVLAAYADGEAVG